MAQLVKVKENKETLMFFCPLNILTLKIRTQCTMFLIKNVNLYIENEEAPEHADPDSSDHKPCIWHTV